MTRLAVAYVRRSHVDAGSPGDISREQQMAAIESRAQIDGRNPASLSTLEDWGKSGRGAKLAQRSEYQRLLDLVKDDRVEVIYAYNWSRLGRSTRQILDLTALCNAHDTSIVAVTGAQVDPRTADGRMLLSILTAVDEWMAEVQAERQVGVHAAKKAAVESHESTCAGPHVCGDLKAHRMAGALPYGEDPSRPDESIDAVLDAFDKAGSYLGAAKLLNATGIVPTRLGKPWSATSVTKIVQRARPQVVRHKRKRGGAAKAPRIFSGLLRCACGSTLTSMAGGGRIRYYCQVAHKDANHARPYVVGEKKVLAWAVEQVASLRKFTSIRNAGPDEAKAKAKLLVLTEKRTRVIDLYVEGAISKVDRDNRLARIDADRAKIETSQHATEGAQLLVRARVDWAATPDEINSALRDLWSHVVMNGGMLPRRASWHPTDEYGEDGPE